MKLDVPPGRVAADPCGISPRDGESGPFFSLKRHVRHARGGNRPVFLMEAVPIRMVSLARFTG
jgi:hypothetical protein